MIRLQEMSAPQVSSYLLGFEDHFTSHSFKQLFWTSFEEHLERELPSPECNPNSSHSPIGSSSSTNGNTEPTDKDEEIGFRINNTSSLVPKATQVADYIFQGAQLKTLNLWDFVSQVDKIRKKQEEPIDMILMNNKENTSVGDDDDAEYHSEEDEELFIDEEDDTIALDEGDTVLNVTKHNCPTFEFVDGHVEMQTHFLKIQEPSQRKVPVMIGPTLPRQDKEERQAQYC